MSLIIGADGGNKNVKMYGIHGGLLFNSELGEYRERKLEQSFSDKDMIFEFRGKKGFAGTLAENESQFSSSKKGDTKAHDEFLIRILLGLHLYSNDVNNFKIVVGQPIGKHNKKEKDKIKNMLLGTHDITINDKKRILTIESAEIAAEGGAAFWSNPKKGIVRIMDFGSGTVNCATLNEGRYVDKDSFTISDGLNTLISNDVEGLARFVCNKALDRWNVDDAVLICGGGAELVIDYVRRSFTNVSLLYPKMETKDEKQLSPIYANAVGFYRIAKKVFKDETKS